MFKELGTWYLWLLIKFKQSHYIMDCSPSREKVLWVNRIPPRWVMTSSVSVLSWESSPLALKNKPTVPVGYHTACRSAQRELNVSGKVSPVCEGPQQTPRSTDNEDIRETESDKEKWTHTPTRSETVYLKLKKTDGNFSQFFRKRSRACCSRSASHSAVFRGKLWYINHDISLASKMFSLLNTYE